MFDTGFLGTSAPFYMDLITLYFGMLPFLLGAAVMLAVKKKYELHYKMQMGVFILTLLVVIVFEVGVRLASGYSDFIQQSNADTLLMALFLGIPIIIALISVVLWAALIYSAIREFRLKQEPLIRSHKKLGKIVYAGVSVTSIMGVMIYYFLFVFLGCQA